MRYSPGWLASFGGRCSCGAQGRQAQTGRARCQRDTHSAGDTRATSYSPAMHPSVSPLGIETQAWPHLEKRGNRRRSSVGNELSLLLRPRALLPLPPFYKAVPACGGDTTVIWSAQLHDSYLASKPHYTY
eukprot:360282-Chlamydomonas_euryale.AAC.8